MMKASDDISSVKRKYALQHMAIPDLIFLDVCDRLSRVIHYRKSLMLQLENSGDKTQNALGRTWIHGRMPFSAARFNISIASWRFPLTIKTVGDGGGKIK
jgi:hypothetical protein